MRSRLHAVALVLLLALPSSPSAGRTRAVRHPQSTETPRSVMWIGAHPDDEAVAAPLLGLWCRELQARCAIVVLTRGEKGACVRPGGCAPDLPSVRSAEAGSAAQLFGATSIHLTYADGGGEAPPQWQTGSADAPDIVTTLAGYIDAFRPEVVLTFDPRHGTTCHPDHREAGQLALDASRLSVAAPRVDFLETLVTLSTDPAAISFSPAFSEARRLDATRILASTGRQAWDFLTEDLTRHASQFDDAFLNTARAVPADQRAVFFATAEDALRQQVMPCP